MSLLDAALEYAAAGWPVFPVRPRGKLPLGRLVHHGFKDASTDEGLVRRWWEAEAQANIGTPTGVIFDVADFDSGEAMKHFDVIAKEHGVNLANFPRAKTGRGRHVMVKPTGVRNKVDIIPGMDWRGAGGYVLLPTSVHASGSTYEWVQRPGPELPDAPAFLLDMLSRAAAERDDQEVERVQHRPGDGLRTVPEAYIRAAVEAELGGVQRAPDGTRNDTLNKAAFALGQMVGARWLGRGEAEIELRAAARVTNLDIDDGEHSVLATIRSGLEAGILKPREAPPDRRPQAAPAPAAEVTAWTTAAALTARTPEQVAWVIHGIAAVGSITEIVASIKGGKSTFIGHAVRALLYGENFLTAVAGPGDVWWITEERPTSFRRLMERTGLLYEERLHILMLQEAKVSWPDMAASAVARAKPGDILIADTIGRLAGLGGDSENDAGDAQKAMAPLEAATQAGLAVIVGRHARKAGGDPENAGRGSSAWSGISDIVIQLSKGGDAQPASVRKINSVSRFEETPDDVLIQLTDDGYQLLGPEGALAYAAAEVVIRRALEEADEVLQSVLLKLKTDADKPLGDGTARRVLDGLQKLHRAERVGRGGHGDPFRWRLIRDTATPPNALAVPGRQGDTPFGGIPPLLAPTFGETPPSHLAVSCKACGGAVRSRPTARGDRRWCDGCNSWADGVQN